MNLSIIIPCLNEVETISQCIKKCFLSIQKMGIEAEVIIADNGSSDGSIEIAEHKNKKILCLMFHPERSMVSKKIILKYLKNFF